MNRRFFFVGLAAMSLPSLARAYPSVPYSPVVWRELRETRTTVVLNFRASWSITCQIKQDIISRLVATNPAYAEMTFVDVDWDTFGPSDFAERRFKVERRSTLIALKRGKEIARLVNEPYERDIRAFLDAALAA